jgi:hypothetical protein
MSFQEITKLIPEYLYKDKFPLSEGTRLEEDLGYYGEDAELLLIEFSKKFNVDISEFDFAKYFSPEPFSFSFLKSNFGNRTKKTSSLTLGDLARAIINRKLI